MQLDKINLRNSKINSSSKNDITQNSNKQKFISDYKLYQAYRKVESLLSSDINLSELESALNTLLSRAIEIWGNLTPKILL